MILLFLGRSAASPGFREAVETFLADGRPSDRVAFSASTPTIKLERTLAKVLEQCPDLPIERITIDGRSGCATFIGQLKLSTAFEERTIDFAWDCGWKAKEMGWTDYFGFPDQTRAAREFGYDCFREWSETSIARHVDTSGPLAN